MCEPENDTVTTSTTEDDFQKMLASAPHVHVYYDLRSYLRSTAADPPAQPEATQEATQTKAPEPPRCPVPKGHMRLTIPESSWLVIQEFYHHHNLSIPNWLIEGDLNPDTVRADQATAEVRRLEASLDRIDEMLAHNMTKQEIHDAIYKALSGHNL